MGSYRRICGILAIAAVGCAGPTIASRAPLPSVPSAPQTLQTSRPLSVEVIVPAGHAAPVADAALREAEAIATVLRENPTLEQMRAAVAAAQARAPQVAALDDPTVTLWTAPGSFGSPNVNPAARAEVSQKLPWPGKRELRGQAANAEANAVARDVDEAKLQLIEATRLALADYRLAEAALALNRETAEVLADIRRNAESRYKTGLAPQQDLLAANVEVARLQEREIAFRRAVKISQARLNTLMHRPPEAPLAPPEPSIASTSLGDVAEIQRRATASRPDVQGLADRLKADEASLALAEREYRPDVEFMAAYDGFWQGMDRPLQWQIGARVNVPIRTDRRSAAVAEAQARIAQRRAELARLRDRITLEIQEAYEQAREADQVRALYAEKIMPAAEASVKEAKAGYITGKVPFLSLAEAQRTLTSLRERQLEAMAEAERRRANLKRSAGEP